MNKRIPSNRNNDLWKALERLAALASVIVVIVLTYIYFQISYWSFLPQQAREFLMGLITNLIPVYILFSISYFLFQKILTLRDNENLEVLARQIVSELQAFPQKDELLKNQQNNSSLNKNILLKSRDEITNINIELIREAKHNIISFSGDLSWTNKCHDALMDAINNGVLIKIICKFPLTDGAKRHVERYIRQAGIELKYFPLDFDPDVRGLMIDTSTSKKSLFVEKKHKLLGNNYQRTGVAGDSSNYEYWGQRYDAENDLAIVSPLVKLFDILWLQASEADVLYPGDLLNVERALKRVRQYQQANITIRFVKIANLKPLHRFIDAQEYKRIQHLGDKLQQQSISFWDTVSIYSATSQKTICPPIIEIYNNEWIILDGLGRVYHAKQLGLTDIVACVVEKVLEPPISVPWTWDKVQVTEQSDYTKNDNFQNPNLAYWRNFDSVHSSLEEINKTRI